MAEQKDILRQTAAFVAEALGEGWRVDTNDDYTWQVCVFGPSEERLSFSNALRATVNLTRVKVSGMYHHLAKQHNDYPRDLKHADITVALDRGPAKIAREIERRLLPTYYAEIERVKASAAEARMAEAAQSSAETRLSVFGSRGYLSLPGPGYGNWSVSYGGETASLELRGLPIDLAEKVLQLVKDAG